MPAHMALIGKSSCRRSLGYGHGVDKETPALHQTMHELIEMRAEAKGGSEAAAQLRR